LGCREHHESKLKRSLGGWGLKEGMTARGQKGTRGGGKHLSMPLHWALQQEKKRREAPDVHQEGSLEEKDGSLRLENANSP